jgi:hypothetical protein
MKRLLVALSAVAVLVGMIGAPSSAGPKPDVTTVSGDLTFVDLDDSTTVHAVFDYQRLSSPNGSVTVTVGAEEPVTFTPESMDGGPVYPPEGDPTFDSVDLYGSTATASDVHLMMYTDAAGVQHASWYANPSSGTVLYGGTVTSGEYTVFWPKVPKAPKRIPFTMTVDATGSTLASPVELTGTVTGRPFDGATVTITVDSLTTGVWLETTYVFTHPKGSVTAYGHSMATFGTGGYDIEVSESGWSDGTGRYAGTTGSFEGPIGTLTYLGGGALTLHAQLVGSYTK